MADRSLPQLHTARLRLRDWTDADLAPFGQLNADPEVMRFMPATLPRAASDAMVARIRAHAGQHGFGLWVVEERERPGLIGFVGLMVPSFHVPSLPAGVAIVEVGWRLATHAWGRGFATEAADAALAYGFVDVGLPEIVSFTVQANERSWRVMRRLGMTHDPRDDFDHPRLAAGHPLRRHVLYRLARDDWRSQRAP